MFQLELYAVLYRYEQSMVMEILDLYPYHQIPEDEQVRDGCIDGIQP